MTYRAGVPLLVFLSLMFTSACPVFGAAVEQAFVLQIEGSIGPATSDYIDRSMHKAAEQGAQLVVLRMDTPGGLDDSMRAIVKRILASELPVVAYVAPSGARAASAGTYILYASHVAAMAPGTNLGAATPVALGGLPGLGEEKEFSPGEGKPDAPTAQTQPKDAMKAKLINDAAAYLRGLARLRGRNAEWAESAVRTAASLPAEEALELGVIDLLASDTRQLLQALDGRLVDLPAGPRTLNTLDIQVVRVVPDWRSRLLSVISNPNVAYILMLVGIYGLIYEFANPGAILPGSAGAVSLLLALYAFQVLPVNYAGVALMLMGMVLMMAEAFVPSFGVLGVMGMLAFVLGSLILIDTDLPGYGIAPPLIFVVAALSALLLVLVVGMALRSRARPVVSGAEELIGAEGVALEDFTGEGTVRLHGEVWSAMCGAPLRSGQRIRVTERQGLVLRVVPLNEKESDP